MKRLFLMVVPVLAIVLAGLVLPAHSVSAAASLKLSRQFAGPGDTINVNGFGFTPGDAVVVSSDIHVNNRAQTIQSVTRAGSNGSFFVAMVIPNGTNQDDYTFIARDFHGHLATAKYTIYARAYVKVGGKVYTTWVIPQQAFFVSGAGFKAGEAVKVSVAFSQFNGNTLVENRNTTAANDGTFHDVFVRVPTDVKPGMTLLTATGASSGRVAKANLHVFYRPTITTAAPGYRPGTAVVVKGQGFVPASLVHVSLTVGRSGQTNETLSRDVTADGTGSFTTTLQLPGNVNNGTYRVTAVDASGGFHAAVAVQVAIHPTVSLTPSTVLPGQAFTITGANFGSGVGVTVTATFNVQGGGAKTVKAYVQTGGNGDYTAQIAVPANANPGQYTVTVSSSNGQTHAPLQVKPRPALPTATAVPPTATSVPPTALPAVPTSTPVSGNGNGNSGGGKHKHFGFRYISVWYHTVRVGTHEHVVVQANLKTQQGIWINFWFPGGRHVAIYKNTDNNGHYEMDEPVYPSDNTPNNHNTLVTFRLWHGKQNVRTYSHITLVG